MALALGYQDFVHFTLYTVFTILADLKQLRSDMPETVTRGGPLECAGLYLCVACAKE